MSWLNLTNFYHKNKTPPTQLVRPAQPEYDSSDAPPSWQAAPEPSHAYGLVHEASDDNYNDAEDFCAAHLPEAPRILSSAEIDDIAQRGCGAWRLASPDRGERGAPFHGEIFYNNPFYPGVVAVVTEPSCNDTCLQSNLPILAGQYARGHQPGVYYEVTIGPRTDTDAVIALGTTCRPYPGYRLPGWNRLSAGLHLDDLRKFFEDPNGGQEYTGGPERVSPGDTVGLGYRYATGEIFFTYNGSQLAVAFIGVYMPHDLYDVYAAVGVCGQCDFQINFGAAPFKWAEGENWKVSGHVGSKLSGPNEEGEALPSYIASTSTRL